MKTFCEVCTANPATLVCLADDAVMCDTCDKRCARDAGKTANRRKTEISFFPFRERRGARKPRRDGRRGARTTRIDACTLSLSCQRSFDASRPGTDPRALPPSPLCPTGSRSIHSANAVVAKHERVAFTANARPMCDICQVRETANRRETHVARRRAARGGVRAVALRAPRGRRRVTPTPFSKRAEATGCRSLIFLLLSLRRHTRVDVFKENSSARFSRRFLSRR